MIEEIYRLLFERNTLGRLKMLGETLASLRTELGGRIAYAVVTRDDFERTGAIPQDTEDLVDYTVSLEGVDVGLLFIEQARGGIKLSVRSRNGLDCSKLAGKFRRRRPPGGGCATLPDPLAESLPLVLDAVRQASALANGRKWHHFCVRGGRQTSQFAPPVQINRTLVRSSMVRPSPRIRPRRG